ncbi:MAG: hypothetical protein CM15mP113_3280 [Pseudomonadota bacterium]|nr:MAG: hypothetical protein CM15mP113_3280 [Pseudomonadota bacterium]
MRLLAKLRGPSLYIDDIVVTGTPTVLDNYNDVASTSYSDQS